MFAPICMGAHLVIVDAGEQSQPAVLLSLLRPCRHSLGGALATLAAAVLQSTDQLPNRVAGVYTFGSPRVGDEGWVEAYEALGLANVTLRCWAATLAYRSLGLGRGWGMHAVQ